MATLLTGEEVRARGLNPDTMISIGGKYDLSSQGGSSQPSGGSTSQEDTIRRAIEMQREAAKPAVASLEAQIPEVQKGVQTRQSQLQAEETPLKQRYQSLLNEIKSGQQTAENRQTVVTANELGKRGIVGSSTLAGQEMANALNPITRQYTGLYQQTGLEQESALRDLANQITNLGLSGTEQERAIRNAIAQLQAGAGSAGITTGISQYGTKLAQDASAKEAERQANLDAFTKRIYEETTLPASKEAIRKSQKESVKEPTLAEQLAAIGFKIPGATPAYTKPPTPSTKNASQQLEYPPGSGVTWVSDGNGGWK